MHPLWQVVSNQDNKSAYDHITVFIELRSFCATAQIQLCCNRFLFQHDTIFVHKARSIKKLSPQFVVEEFDWPVQLNSIQHLWDDLKCGLWARADFTDAVLAEWEQISSDKL